MPRRGSLPETTPSFRRHLRTRTLLWPSRPELIVIGLWFRVANRVFEFVDALLTIVKRAELVGKAEQFIASSTFFVVSWFVFKVGLAFQIQFTPNLTRFGKVMLQSCVVRHFCQVGIFRTRGAPPEKYAGDDNIKKWKSQDWPSNMRKKCSLWMRPKNGNWRKSSSVDPSHLSSL